MALKAKIGVLVMALLEDDYNKTGHMRPAATAAAQEIADALASERLVIDDDGPSHARSPAGASGWVWNGISTTARIPRPSAGSRRREAELP